MKSEDCISNDINKSNFDIGKTPSSVVNSIPSEYKSTAVNSEPPDESNQEKSSNARSENAPKITTRQIILIMLIIYGYFWTSAWYSFIAPFFPQEASKKGTSATVYGFIFATFPITQFLTAPIFGRIIPIVTPRFMMISGLFVSASCSILFGVLCYAPDGLPFIALAFAVRLVEAAGTSAYYVSALTTAATEFPTRVATVLSVAESASGIGMIVGPTIGGALYQVGGYVMPFATLGGILMVGTIISVFVVPYIDSSKTESTGSLRKLMKHWNIYIYMAVTIYTNSAIGFTESTLSNNLSQFDLQPVAIGAVFAIPAVLYALSGPIWGYLCDKIPKPELFCLLGCIFCAISFIGIGPLPFLHIHTKLWLVIVSLITLSIGISGAFISSFVLCLSEAKKVGLPDDISTNALISGLFSCAFGLGCFIGPAVGGIMLDHIGYGNATTIYVGVSILVVLMALITFVCSLRKKSDVGNGKDSQPALQS